MVGYGCTTCIGNSGPVADEIAKAVKDHNLVVSAVLSGNRNFEGRINPVVRANYLASPPLVVAFAIAGTVDIDLRYEPLGIGRRRQAGLPGRHLADAGGGPAASLANVGERRYVPRAVRQCVHRQRAVERDPGGRAAICTTGTTTRPISRTRPISMGMTREMPPLRSIHGARVLALLGDSVTTDHISPAGSIAQR